MGRFGVRDTQWGRPRRRRAKDGLCPNCRAVPKGRSGYCAACWRAYPGRSHVAHSDLTPEERMRANARSYANVYLRRGKIARLPCAVCGAEQGAKMRHRDYAQPLAVTWVCDWCVVRWREQRA